MASVTTRTNGSRMITFTRDKKRRTIHLGKLPEKVAERVCTRVEYLLAAKLSGVAVDAETARWVADIDDRLATKLAKVELIEPRAAKSPDATLDAFVTGYIDSLGVKSGTRFNLHLARRNLVD